MWYNYTQQRPHTTCSPLQLEVNYISNQIQVHQTIYRQTNHEPRQLLIQHLKFAQCLPVDQWRRHTPICKLWHSLMGTEVIISNVGSISLALHAHTNWNISTVCAMECFNARHNAWYAVCALLCPGYICAITGFMCEHLLHEENEHEHHYTNTWMPLIAHTDSSASLAANPALLEWMVIMSICSLSSCNRKFKKQSSHLGRSLAYDLKLRLCWQHSTHAAHLWRNAPPETHAGPILPIHNYGDVHKSPQGVILFSWPWLQMPKSRSLHRQSDSATVLAVRKSQNTVAYKEQSIMTAPW